MATLFQKIFLPKKQWTLYDTIAQNADKMTYEYNEDFPFLYHVIKLTTQTINLQSVFRAHASQDETFVWYTIQQYDSKGRILESDTQKSTKFAKNVHKKMFDAFVKSHGIKAVYKQQDIFQQQKQK